ncbi:MAG TPA: ABC transporter transmembrane domain-containing protein, partial [Bacillota bacterium]|nr:ABC transporter transmembrane domain-containing protein [Bacillota bacterium]
MRHFTELSYTHYSLSDYEEFQVEELLSSARIVARRRADADSLPRTELIANLSNTYKNEAYKFVRKINALIKGENNESSGDNNEDKKDEKEELFCPKCGRRYADPERKICMRCMDKVHIIKRFSIFFARYKFQIGAIIFTMILTSALGILAPYISSGFYYDEVLDQNGRFYGKILLVIGIILATRIISILVSIVNGVISSRVAAKVTYDLKKEIFGAIERLSIGYFTNRQTGGLMTQVNNDANNIYWFFCDIVPYSIVNVFQIIGIIVIMLIMEPVLTLISLVTVPIAFFLIRKVFAILEKYHAKRYSQSRSLNSLLSDILTGIRVVKAFSKESEEAARFDVRNKSLAAANMKASVFNTTVFPFISMLIYISNMLVLG